MSTKLPSSNSSDWLCWGEQETNRAMKLLQIEGGPSTSSGSAKAWVTSSSVFYDFRFGREVIGMEREGISVGNYFIWLSNKLGMEFGVRSKLLPNELRM